MKPKLSPEQIHKVKDVIQYLSSIPDEKWCTQSLTRRKGDVIQHCAWGHLLQSYTSEYIKEISHLLFDHTNGCLTYYNDFKREGMKGDTPKERVLNALKTILEK